MSPGPVEKYHHPIAKRDDWETPPELFGRYHAEFGFTLDACALPHNAKCPVYFTPADDGLAQDWGSHVVWVNPPYGRAISAWMRKAYLASLRGATVVCLVPSRTDSAWWHDWVMAASAERRFLRGRVRFVGAPYNAPFPCALVIFRPNTNLQLLAEEAVASLAARHGEDIDEWATRLAQDVANATD